MNRLAALLVLVLSVCALPARAALVYDGYPTGPGGLSLPYADPTGNTSQVYAGLIEMNIGGVSVLAMSDDYNARSNVGESWPMTLYTYDDVQAGAPVRFTPAQYARAGVILGQVFFTVVDPTYSSFSLRQWAEANGNDALAEVNTRVWEVMSSTVCPSFFGGDCSQIDAPPVGPGSFNNWARMMVVASGGPGRDEYLIPLGGQNFTLGPVVPVPPAFWLLGSGLLGLVGVARKKHSAPH